MEQVLFPPLPSLPPLPLLSLSPAKGPGLRSVGAYVLQVRFKKEATSPSIPIERSQSPYLKRRFDMHAEREKKKRS